MQNFLEKFKSEIKSDELIVWRGAYSNQNIEFGWNRQANYNGWHKTPASPGYFVVKGRETLLGFSRTLYRAYASEIFSDYLQKRKTLSLLKKTYKKSDSQISKLYYKIQSLDLSKLTEEKLINELKKCVELMIELEVKSIYIEEFDREIVELVLGGSKKEILNKIWEHATHPAFESFDVRRLKLLLKFGVSKKGIRKAQFIFTDYFDSQSWFEIEKRVVEVVKDKDNVKKIKEAKTLLKKQQKEFSTWRKKLNKEEKQIVDYIQYVMELRDLRKDPLAMCQAIKGNIAKELLMRVGLPEDLSPFIASQEIVSGGMEWLKNNLEILKKRPEGCFGYMGADGSITIELCDFESNAKALEKFAEESIGNSINTVEKVKKLLKGRELWPLFNNYSFFGQGNGYYLDKLFKPYYPEVLPIDVIVVMKKDESIELAPGDELEVYSKYMFGNYLSDDSEVELRKKKLKDLQVEVDKLYENLTLEKINTGKTESLIKIVDELRNKLFDMNGYICYTITFDKRICLEVLKEKEYPITSDRLDEIWEKGIHPVMESFEKSQRRYMFESIIAGVKGKELAERAQYIKMNYYGLPTFEDVEAWVRNDFGSVTPEQAKAEIDNLDQELSRVKEVFDAWFETLTPSEKRLVSYFQDIIEYRDRRKDLYLKSYVIFWNVFLRIMDEAGISRELLPFVQFEELLSGPMYLKSVASQIEKRPEGVSLLIEHDGKITIEPIDYDWAKKELNDYYIQSTTGGKAVEEIKGQVGSPSKAQGRVKVVLDASKPGDFQDGDILVTGMTRPEYVPLMKKAGAIVTDEGGITCHAAIVSRELKKPCIIGTKNATRVLKDGDMVEVDANTGIVKKI